MGTDLNCQIGPAKFGFRNRDGTFSWEELCRKAELPQIKAFELKLGQGAKIRGGHLEGFEGNTSDCRNSRSGAMEND